MAGEAPSGRSVAVFSPAPLLTVTIESGADGRPELHLHAGGQGFWVARMVARLGVPVTLCAPFGGDPGRVLRTLVEAEDVVARVVETNAPNGSYVHDRRGGERIEICAIPGEPLTRHEVDDLYNASLVVGLNAGVAVLAGQPFPVVPPETYRRLARDLRANGCLVVADLSGADLEQCLLGGVDVLKISHEQVLDSGLSPDDSPRSLLRAVARLHDGGAVDVVVSRAERPALARVGDEVFEIVVPRIEAMDFRGGGDSMTAAIAAGLAWGREMPELLRLAAAAGSLNVTRHGLGTGNRADIEEMSRLVDVRRRPELEDPDD